MKVTSSLTFITTAYAISSSHEQTNGYSQTTSRSTAMNHCFHDILDEFYITEFLQAKIDDLNRNGNCWSGNGLPKLRDSLESTITSSLYTNITIPTCPIDIRSGSDSFSLDLVDGAYNLNGLPGSLLVPLLLLHRESI